MGFHLHSFYFCFSFCTLLLILDYVIKNILVFSIPHLSYTWVHVSMCMHIHVYVTDATDLYRFHAERLNLSLYSFFTLLNNSHSRRVSKIYNLFLALVNPPLVFQQDLWVWSHFSPDAPHTKTFWYPSVVTSYSVFMMCFRLSPSEFLWLIISILPIPSTFNYFTFHTAFNKPVEYHATAFVDSNSSSLKLYKK